MTGRTGRTGRARIACLTLLALAVPPFALGGGQGSPQAAALSVSASLGGCGLADAAIVCRIDASWTAIEGTDYYTVSVTRPDGSVVDLGQNTGTGRALYVSYVGPGRYAVQVAAWGTPPGEEEHEVLDRDRTTPRDKPAVRTAAEPEAEPDLDEAAGPATAASEDATEPAAGAPAPTREPAPKPAEPVEPGPEGGAEAGATSAVRSDSCPPQPQQPCPPPPGSS